MRDDCLKSLELQREQRPSGRATSHGRAGGGPDRERYAPSGDSATRTPNRALSVPSYAVREVRKSQLAGCLAPGYRVAFASALPGWGPWSEKAGVAYAHAPASALCRVVALRVHLDTSTTDNGPLRVVPHSNVLGVLTDEELGSAVKKHGFVECLVPKGGILTMSPLIIHSSSKARIDAPRRVLHIEYADSRSLGQGIDLAVA